MAAVLVWMDGEGGLDWRCAVCCAVALCVVLCCVVLCCGVLCCVVVWCGEVCCVVVWCGVLWCGVVCCGVVWCSGVGCGVVCLVVLPCLVLSYRIVCCGVLCCIFKSWLVFSSVCSVLNPNPGTRNLEIETCVNPDTLRLQGHVLVPFPQATEAYSPNSEPH